MTARCETCGCGQDDLNDAMQFDHPVRVDADGTVHDRLEGVYAPELLMAVTSDGQILAQHETDYADQARRQGWELLHGWTGQYGYSGLVMHPSEYIGGALADHIRETPGTYVVVEVRTDDDDEQPTGWAVARKMGVCSICGRSSHVRAYVDDDHPAVDTAGHEFTP